MPMKKKNFVYFDNASTSYPKPECVVNAIRDYVKNIGVNAGRSAYQRAVEAARIVFETRELLARLIGAEDSSRVIFTQNATEALNLAILGLGLKKGDIVITSSIEHNAVMRPLRYLEKEIGVKIEIVECQPDAQLLLESLESKITRKVKLIVMTHASNVIGTILPITEVGKIAQENRIPFLVDAAQTAGCIPVNVGKNGIDLMAFSGHKGLYGPQGIGCLYINTNIRLKPLKFGGTGSNSEFQTQPDFLPDKYESGTLNLPGIAGLRSGIEFVLTTGMNYIRNHLQNLTKKLIEKLSENDQIIIYGTKNFKLQTGIVSINVKNKEPSEVGKLLDRKYSIATRVGLHCSPQTHMTIGTFPKGTVRISFGVFNQSEDIDILHKALCEITG